MNVVRSEDGTQLRLGAEIGRGGEGAVFDIQGTPDLVAKLYRTELRVTRRPKIEAMVRATTPGLANFVAWPTFAVYEQSRRGEFCGFAMQKIAADYIPIHNLYGPSSRRLKFPGRDWRFLVRAAENLASAIAEIHAAGHVLGDINHSNALVNNEALVRFIDADSFQVRHNGTLHRCTVGVPEFTPPELQGINLANVERTVEHDRFGLAVLVFKLLFMGRHPFAGRFARGDVSLPDAIKDGLFAYSTTMASEAEPPPNTLELQDVGDTLAALFDKAFLTPLSIDRGRPDCAAWVGALQRLQRDVNRCRQHPHHYYPGGTGSCIWCDFRAQGIDYFPDPAARTYTPTAGTPLSSVSIDDELVERLWAAVTAVPKRPGFDDSLVRRSFVVAPLPPLKPLSGWSFGEGWGCIILLAIGAGAAFFGPPGGAVVVGLVAFLGWLGPALQRKSISSQQQDPRRKAMEEQTRRREKLAQQIRAVQSTLAKAVEEHERSWQLLRANLSIARQKLEEREQARSVEIQSATDRLTAGQREAYLRSKLIRTASIHGVGDSLTSSLISYGFESAFDVLNAGSTSVVSRTTRGRTGAPDCPYCGSTMRKRTARRGRNAGRDFWGCSRYPNCTGTRDISYTSFSSTTTATTSSGLEAVPGIGPVKSGDISAWARRMDRGFRPSLNPGDLAAEKQRIEAAHGARVQQLAEQLRGGPAELSSINNRFGARVAGAVAQYNALAREW